MKNFDIGLQLAGQNLKMRFEKSHVGIAWFFIEPLIFIGIFYLVFSNIMTSHVPHFALYLCIGIIPWSFIAAAVQDASRSLFVRRNFIHNTALDARVIPFSVCCAHSVGFSVSLAVLFGIMFLWQEVPLGLRSLLVPLVMALQMVFCYGMSLVVAIVSVFVRDIMYGMHLFLMLWFYATPIFYTVAMVPERFRWVVTLNPMTYFIAAYRDLMLNNTFPDLRTWVVLGSAALVSYGIGTFMFQRNTANIIKEL